MMKTMRLAGTMLMVLMVMRANVFATEANNLMVKNEAFEKTYQNTLREANEYCTVHDREYQIWTICRKAGSPKFVAGCYNEWEVADFYNISFASGKNYDFFLVGRVCEDGTEDEMREKFEDNPVFMVLYNLVPPNENRIQKMGELYSYLEEKNIPVFWKVEPLTEEKYTHGEYIVEVGFGTQQWAPLR